MIIDVHLKPRPECTERGLANQALVPQWGRELYVNLGLGKRAALTIADTYETEETGVLGDTSRRERINAERTELIRNIAEASRLGLQPEAILEKVERGIASLQD
jgi:hypothetical protein